MSTNVEHVLTQALQMSPQDRALIAERLLSSLDAEADLEIEIAWQQEAQRRIEEIDRGEVVCLPWEQVISRLRGNTRVNKA